MQWERSSAGSEMMRMGKAFGERGVEETVTKMNKVGKESENETVG